MAKLVYHGTELPSGERGPNPLTFVAGRTPHRNFVFNKEVPVIFTAAQYEQQFITDDTVQMYREDGKKVRVKVGKAYFEQDLEHFIGKARNVDEWTMYFDAKEVKKFSKLAEKFGLQPEAEETDGFYKLVPIPGRIAGVA